MDRFLSSGVLIQTDINHFMAKGGKFITETEFVDAIFFCGFFDLIVLFFRFFVKEFSGWSFQFEIHVVITASHHLRKEVIYRGNRLRDRIQ